MAAPEKAPETTYERVLREFKVGLSDEEKADFSATTLMDLKLTISAIQKRQASTRTMQNLTRLRGFLEAMESYGKVLDIFVNVHNFVAFIWGPMKFLLQVASTFAEAFNALLDAYQRIAESMPILAQFQELFERDPNMKQILEVLFQDIFEFHQRALRYFRGSVWKQLFHATWKQFNTKFGSLLENMKHQKALVETQASLIEFQQARAARGLLEMSIKNIEEQEKLRRRNYLAGWLMVSDFSAEQEKGESTRRDRPESGRWLFQRHKFRAWYDPRSTALPLLWINGIPGAGKTVLASLVVEECRKLTDTTVLFFYHRHGDSEHDNFIAVARSLISQMLQKHDALLPFVFDTATSSGQSSLSGRKLAEQLLDTCLKAVGKCYIIADGLDECSESEQTLVATWLRQFVEGSAIEVDPCRCVFLSQDDSSTRALLSKLPTLHIEASDNEADIAIYCRSRAKDIQSKFGLNDDQASDISNRAAQSAQGMFLYARLVMSNLLEQTSVSKLYAELQPETFPKGLDEALLKWREIQGAVSIDLESGTVDFRHHQLMVGIKDLCGSLVEELSDGSITFVHTTVKFYLQRSQLVEVEAEHLELALLCISYFNFREFDTQVTDSQLDSFVKTGSYAFFEYAIASWTKHLALGLTEKTSSAQLHRLEETLTIFFDLHWLTPDQKSKIPKSLLRLVKRIQQVTLRDKLLQTIGSVHHFLSSDLIHTSPFETLDLFGTLSRARQATERLATLPADVSAVTQYYGPNLFKCSRMHCKWFHAGFASDDQRRAHYEKHERSHYCPRPGCHIAILGCTSAKDLEAHLAAYHGESPSENDFPEDSSSESEALPRGHQCQLCSRIFTTSYNLKTHLRTHNPERPFKCRECGLGFGRKPDCKRHERRVHNRVL